MSAPRKLLLVSGLALAVWGMGYGLLYALVAEHQALDEMGASLASAFALAAERRMPEAHRAIDTFAQTQFNYVRHVDVHSHWTSLAMLLIVFGAIFDRVRFDERKRLYLATMLVVGAVSFPLGVVLETMNQGPIPKAVAVLGSGLVTLALAAVALGLARGGGAEPRSPEREAKEA
ncbi:MAG TPA: hypothetical protein VKE24_14720 [Candidatus Acidoferrales bacterium]|nr:hypothetical protein [Candidatus Acidoferrales bacterium]